MWDKRPEFKSKFGSDASSSSITSSSSSSSVSSSSSSSSDSYVSDDGNPNKRQKLTWWTQLIKSKLIYK